MEFSAFAACQRKQEVSISAVREGARAREYENALQWLINAELVRKVSKISRPGLPIMGYEDLSAFKIYMNDVGLLRKHSFLAASAFTEESRLFTEFKGALTENFVLESLIRHFNVHPYYWADTTHEVDYIIQIENNIFPVEVKAGQSIMGASIKQYLKKYDSDTPVAIRYSLKNLSFDGKMLNIPLYMIDETGRILSLIKFKQ